MAVGEPFTPRERRQIDETIRSAEQRSRFEFSVYVGPSRGEPRPFATRLHNTLTAPSRSVLVMVDDERRLLEIVTGGKVRAKVDDAHVLEVVATMLDRFRQDDLVGGITQGVARLSELASSAPALDA